MGNSTKDSPLLSATPFKDNASLNAGKVLFVGEKTLAKCASLCCRLYITICQVQDLKRLQYNI